MSIFSPFYILFRRSSHETPSSIRSIQRQSSGSESSGYFTPPHAERPSAAASPIQRPESIIKAVTPLESPQRINSSPKEPIETQTSTDEHLGEEVEYIEVSFRKSFTKKFYQ